MPSLAPARRDDQVAGERDLQAAGDGEALDRGDQRLARRRAATIPAKPRSPTPRALARDERLEVHPGAEALARAGEDADAQLVVAVELVERRGDALGERAVDRVARVGAVERDEQDAVAALGEDAARRSAISDMATPRSLSRRAYAG